MPDASPEAQRWWREQLERFTVYDDVGAVGSGPVAFASFAFADDSTEASVMVVPEVVLGRRDGQAWLTTIGTPPRLSSPQPVSPPALLRYAHGAASVTAHRAAVAEAVRRIAAGDVEKVVLAHDLVAIADGPIDARFVLAGLADRYPDCWTFAVEGLVGATPELLARVAERPDHVAGARRHGSARQRRGRRPPPAQRSCSSRPRTSRSTATRSSR